MATLAHDVDLDETQLMDAIREKLEDRIAEVVSHAVNVNTVLGKSTITMKIEVVPDENRRRFNFKVVDTVSLAPKRPYIIDMVGGKDRDNKVRISPLQLTIND